jgi:hypothetical protein
MRIPHRRDARATKAVSVLGPLGMESDGLKHRWTKPQHVYPHDQPRRGGITFAGADRPRNGRRKGIPSSSTGGGRHRQSLCRPSGPARKPPSLSVPSAPP